MHSINPTERDFILQEGSYQLPIFIQDPRTLPVLKMDFLMYLEKIPCASLLVRINRAQTGAGGKVLSAKTVP